MPSFRDVGNEGGRGGGHTPPTKIWAEQFTLSLNQGGQILPHQSTTCASRFSDVPTPLSFGGELSRGDRGLSVQRAGGLAIILWNLSCHQFSLIKIGLLPARLLHSCSYCKPRFIFECANARLFQNYNLKFTFNFSENYRLTEEKRAVWNDNFLKDLPYARHYKPRLVYFLTHFQRPFLCF